MYDSVQTASDLNAILSLKFFYLSNTTLTIATEPYYMRASKVFSYFVAVYLNVVGLLGLIRQSLV